MVGIKTSHAGGREILDESKTKGIGPNGPFLGSQSVTLKSFDSRRAALEEVVKQLPNDRRLWGRAVSAAVFSALW